MRVNCRSIQCVLLALAAIAMSACDDQHSITGVVQKPAVAFVHTLVYGPQDFNGGALTGWSNPITTTSPGSVDLAAENFLGEFGNGKVTLTLPLAAHDSVIVEFDLYIIRSWDGIESTWGGPDSIRVEANGIMLARSTFGNAEQAQNFPFQTNGTATAAGNGAAHLNWLGYTYWSDLVPCDAIYHVMLAFPHSSSTLTVDFIAGGLQDISDESWGLDKVSVSISSFAGPLTTITVTPNPANLLTNDVQQFTAVGTDVNGDVVVITPTWSVVAGGGTIDAAGLFTAGSSPGTFTGTIQATSGAISGVATVNVTSPLGSAAAFAILAGAGISCATSGAVSGAAGVADIGSSPTLTVTGFPSPCTLTGSIPLAAVVATAQGDLTAAYLAAQGQACTLDLTGIDLGYYDGSTSEKSLLPGTYCFSTSATLTTLTGTLKLTGTATDKWTFQVGSTLSAEVGATVTLAGGAIPDNVYWAVGTSATLKTNAAFKGNILALTSITLQNGATLFGRALAQNGAVDMIAGAASIIKP